MKHHPETIALARMAGARMVRALATARVSGAAIVAAVADALVTVTAEGVPDSRGQNAYGYNTRGQRTASPLNGDTAIIVWATLTNHPTAPDYAGAEVDPQ